MAIELDYDPGRHLLVLRGNLTILHVAEAHAQLTAHPDAQLDLAGIVELDAAGLQLLLAAGRDAGMHVVAASDAVDAIVQLTGLSELVEA